ncbi:MAG: Crp/Fnr family transcriptional regulator [Bacteroidota bacterium]
MNQFVTFDEDELKLILPSFQEKKFKKREFLLKEGEVCNFIGFIAKGCIRHYHVHDGVERTCYVSFENNWVTDTLSFSEGTKSHNNYQTLEATTLYTIERNTLYELYKKCPKFESLARIMNERLAKLTIELCVSLASYPPEERYKNLLKQQPEIFQRVPQRYIAHILGIQPESLSRIKNRLASNRFS